MHSLTFSEIGKLLKIVPVQLSSDRVIESLLTDSRKLLIPHNTLFFAISGPQRDANLFVGSLYESGVRCFIINDDHHKIDVNQFTDGNFIITGDVTKALQDIAAYHRHRFEYPVIGITGSNGKTIVKEWLYQLLSNDHNIVRSPKSYNSQVGVPLSVWNMSDMHTLGIFEAGISQPAEMQRLQKIIDPQIGVFTYTGNAHAEGFKDVHQKINEKLLLFVNSKVLVYCSDDEDLQSCVIRFKNSVNGLIMLFSWSTQHEAEVFVRRIKKQQDGSIIYCLYKNTGFDFFIPFIDDASIQNAITCCCVLLCMDVPVASIAAHINQLRQVEMRLELKGGINNCSIINDSYSADLNSLIIALDFLSQQQQHTRRTVILSDILQSGLHAEKLYDDISEMLIRKDLYRFIGIGPEISSHQDAFKDIGNKKFFQSTEEFLKQLHSLDFSEETILLKGARIFRFEKISNALEQKMHETVLEINLNALRNNLKLYTLFLKEKVMRMVMVKAFSYGSGSYEIANVLQHAGVEYLAVAYADEGVSLRKGGIRLPIMVMNTEEAGFDNIIQYQLEPELYSFNILNAFIRYLQLNHIYNYPVHIKLDTGMHRLGFLVLDIDPLCEILSRSEHLKLVSVFSHLAASDEEMHDDFTKEQAASFVSMSKKIQDTVGYTFLKHIANTSAIHRHPEMQYDMVRLGIGLYGVDTRMELQNVTTLKTSISQIKPVKKGETIGYSRKALLKKDTVIAIVRIGYADGYPRSLGNGSGKMLLNDQLVPVIGNVCMDMTMLDITGIDAKEGDELIVFGAELPVSKVAEWAGTIPYEILTNISQRVKRVYYEE
ncbi:MAG: bifunctional UDP-N-acetylmuramoyl-tripeptide:D-alanyl-D-alanine ligase/alanine racemase [Ferruginibacter sp.]